MAIVISKSYLTIKKETGPEFARKILLENLENNKGNVEKTAREMRCSKNTLYLALVKQKENNLKDNAHIPKRPHPNKTEERIIEKLVKRRKETGFGKRRLHYFLYTQDGILIPESTIGKVLSDKKLERSKKRVRREYHRIKYNWDKIVPFAEAELDTKEILDKRTLPVEIYDYIAQSAFIPRYQWTLIDVVTKIRFLAWSYSRDWSCGQVFGKMVIWWLRLFGLKGKVIIWSDGGTEFNAAQLSGFERGAENF